MEHPSNHFIAMAQEFLRTTIEVETSPIVITYAHWKELADRNKRLVNGTGKKVSAFAEIAKLVEPQIDLWRHFFGARDLLHIARIPQTKKKPVVGLRKIWRGPTEYVSDASTYVEEICAWARIEAQRTYTLNDHLEYLHGKIGYPVPGQRTCIALTWKAREEKFQWEGEIYERFNEQWIPTGIIVPDEITDAELRARFLLESAGIPINSFCPDFLHETAKSFVQQNPANARQKLIAYWTKEAGGVTIPHFGNPFFGTLEKPIEDLPGYVLQLQ